MLAVIGEAQTAREGLRQQSDVPRGHPDGPLARGRSDQAVFIRELTDFAVKLRRLRGDIALPEMQKILEELFGEKPARSAVKDYVEREHKMSGVGSRFIPARQRSPQRSPAGGTPSACGRRRAQFFGDHPDDLPKRR